MTCYFVKVDCMWENFGDWSDCNATCGGGTRKRYRQPSQLPMHGGKSCSGITEEIESCYENPCKGKTANNYCTALKLRQFLRCSCYIYMMILHNL